MDNILSSLSCICIVLYVTFTYHSIHSISRCHQQFSLISSISFPPLPLPLNQNSSFSPLPHGNVFLYFYRRILSNHYSVAHVSNSQLLFSCTRLFVPFLHLSILHSSFFFFCRLVYFTFSGVLFVLSRLCLCHFSLHLKFLSFHSAPMFILYASLPSAFSLRFLYLDLIFVLSRSSHGSLRSFDFANLLLTYFQVTFVELEQTCTNNLTGDYKIQSDHNLLH